MQSVILVVIYNLEYFYNYIESLVELVAKYCNDYKPISLLSHFTINRIEIQFVNIIYFMQNFTRI